MSHIEPSRSKLLLGVAAAHVIAIVAILPVLITLPAPERSAGKLVPIDVEVTASPTNDDTAQGGGKSAPGPEAALPSTAAAGEENRDTVETTSALPATADQPPADANPLPPPVPADTPPSDLGTSEPVPSGAEAGGVNPDQPAPEAKPMESPAAKGPVTANVDGSGTANGREPSLAVAAPAKPPAAKSLAKPKPKAAAAKPKPAKPRPHAAAAKPKPPVHRAPSRAIAQANKPNAGTLGALIDGPTTPSVLPHAAGSGH